MVMSPIVVFGSVIVVMWPWGRSVWHAAVDLDARAVCRQPQAELLGADSCRAYYERSA